MVTTHTERALLDRIFAREGGFVDHPADAGGPTNFGITASTLGQFRGLSGPVSAQAVRNLTKAEAEQIYLAEWIRKLRLGEIKRFDKAWLIFDASVLFGQTRAVQWAQEASGAPADGRIGPVTLRAINDAPVRRFVIDMVTLRMMRHATRCKESPSQVAFIRGWTARAMELLDLIQPPKKKEA
jgi:lysozyme family protein